MASRINLRYPLATLDRESDYLLMDIIEYKPSGLSGTPLRRALTQGIGNQTATFIASIILPIPTQITSSNGVSWNGGEMNILEREALGTLTRIQESGFKDAIGQLGDLGKRAIDIGKGSLEGGAVTTGIATKIIQAFGSQVTLSQALARKTGQVLNPNMELLFQGPGLRSFDFNFQFAARNEEEGRMIKNIIRTINKNMSPKLTNNEIFLCTPNIFQLKFQRGGGDHPFLNRFKQMALVSAGVDYTGSGTYTTYEDGTPTIINMGLSFQELAPIYSQDYDDEEGRKGVGY